MSLSDWQMAQVTMSVKVECLQLVFLTSAGEETGLALESSKELGLLQISVLDLTPNPSLLFQTLTTKLILNSAHTSSKTGQSKSKWIPIPGN